MRNLLYMAAITALQWNAEPRELYERLIAAGQAAGAAIIAVMRKLVVMTDALQRDRWKWAPTEYLETIAESGGRSLLTELNPDRDGSGPG